LHSSSLEKLILKGCLSLVEVHQSIVNLTSVVYLNLEGCWSLKILPESIGNVKSLETLNISGCSQLKKLSERMGDMESLTELLANGIENEQFLSLIGQLKHVKRLSLCQNSSAPPSSSLISAGVLNWKRWLPTSFIEWILSHVCGVAAITLPPSSGCSRVYLGRCGKTMSSCLLSVEKIE